MQQSSFIIFIGLLFASKGERGKKLWLLCRVRGIEKKKVEVAKKCTPGEYKSDKKIWILKAIFLK